MAKSFVKKSNKRQKTDDEGAGDKNALQKDRNDKSDKSEKETHVMIPLKQDEGNVIGNLLKYTDLFRKAEKLYREDEDKVNNWGAEKDRDTAYYQTMIKKGTQADRVNALTMLMQKNPSRSLNYLQ